MKAPRGGLSKTCFPTAASLSAPSAITCPAIGFHDLPPSNHLSWILGSVSPDFSILFEPRMSSRAAVIKSASSEIPSGDPAPGASKLVGAILVASKQTEVAGQDPLRPVDSGRITPPGTFTCRTPFLSTRRQFFYNF
ncbi:MAG: hypothetical protein M0Z50_10810 [Planctomycetia bacterium]|nr:hypothetical protein [Planctomycetia bacterium]